MFWKNGCILVAGIPNINKDLDKDAVYNVKRFYKAEDLHGSSLGWYMEKDGYVVHLGQFTNGVMTALEGGGNKRNQADLQEWLGSINRVAALTEAELFGQQAAYGDVEETEFQKQLVSVNSSLKNTLMFRLDVPLGDIQAGSFGRIIDVKKDGTANFVLIDTDKETGELFVTNKEPYSVPWKALRQLESTGILTPVEVMPVQVPVTRRRLVPLASGKTGSIPDEFYLFGLNKEQLKTLSEAIYMGVNVTPLLNKNITASADFVQSLHGPLIDYSEFSQSRFTAEESNTLCFFLQNGLSVRDILPTLCDPEYTKLVLNDLESNWADYANDKVLTSIEQNLLRVLFTNQVSIHDSVREEYIRFVGRQYGIEQVAQKLWDYGNIDGDTVRIPWRMVNERKEIFAFLSCPDADMGSLIQWNELLPGIFENALYFEFSPQYGFALILKDWILCRDQNSVILCNNKYETKWRILRINEKSIGYGDELSSYYFRDTFSKRIRVFGIR